MLEPYLSWNSGHLYREPRKRHKRGANSPYGRREVHGSGRGRGGGAGQGHDLLDRQRSFSRCSGLLMPISRWISVSNRGGMMTPLFTLARKQPRTRLASRLRTGTGDRRQEVMHGRGGTDTRGPGRGCGCGGGGGAHTHLQPDHNSWPVPLCEGTPCLQASSSNSCLQVTKHSKFKNHYYTRV